MATRSVLLFLWMMLSLSFAGGAWASQPTPTLAPDNPAYLQYLQGRHGEVKAAKTAVAGAQSADYAAGVPSPVDSSYLTGQHVFRQLAAVTLPAQYDLRLTGKLPPVRNQGLCNSSWAFAALGSLESNLLPAQVWDFSENNLLNTHGFDFGPCSGGTGEMAMAYLARWSGPVTEAEDPYNISVDTTSSQPANQPAPSPAGLQPKAHLQEMLTLPPRSGPLDNDNIKQAVFSYGATVVYLFLDPAAYDDVRKSYYYGLVKPGNVAVDVVGWDDTYDKNNFRTPAPDNGAFILRGSWGPGFGDGGYFYVSYYDANLGKNPSSLFMGNFDLSGSQPTANYSRIYQYDPLGHTASLGYNTQTAFFANIFTASADEQLAAASFYTPVVGSSYEIAVFKGATGGPITGTLSSQTAGSIAVPGYHTVTLPTPVPLVAGEKFSVVVKLTTPGYTNPIAVEMPKPSYSSQAVAHPGESYMSPDGSYWQDASVFFPNTNVCLKAFTINSAPCTLATSSASHSFSQTGGGDSIAVTASGSNCPWTALSATPWVAITSATPASGNGTVTYTVAANDSPTARSTTIFVAGQTFVINQAGKAAAVNNLVRNPGLESGKQEWTTYDGLGQDVIRQVVSAHSGNYAMWLGGADFVANYAYQDIAIPAAIPQAFLQFWYLIDSQEITTNTVYDKLAVVIADPATSAALATPVTLSNLDRTYGGWVQSPQYDVSAFRGKTVRLTFSSTSDGSRPTSFLVDDVQLSSALTVPPTVPGAPLSVSAAGGNGQAVVSFAPPASDGGAAIIGYAVTSNPPGGIDSSAGSTSLTHVVTGLSNGTPYTFTVYAANAIGTGSGSAASNQVIPAVPPPAAAFQARPASGGAPFTVNFTDQSQTATSWLWSFGDGTTSTQKNPTHTYPSRGVYTVTLTAGNQSGNSSVSKRVRDFRDISSVILMLLND